MQLQYLLTPNTVRLCHAPAHHCVARCWLVLVCVWFVFCGKLSQCGDHAPSRQLIAVPLSGPLLPTQGQQVAAGAYLHAMHGPTPGILEHTESLGEQLLVLLRRDDEAGLSMLHTYYILYVPAEGEYVMASLHFFVTVRLWLCMYLLRGTPMQHCLLMLMY